MERLKHSGREGKNMEYRKLGNSSLTVSPICFGGNVFGWTADEATSFKLLDACVDAGLNFIDTAEMYPVPTEADTQGLTDKYIGSWLRKMSARREDIVLATKVSGRSE